MYSSGRCCFNLVLASLMCLPSKQTPSNLKSHGAFSAAAVSGAGGAAAMAGRFFMQGLFAMTAGVNEVSVASDAEAGRFKRLRSDARSSCSVCFTTFNWRSRNSPHVTA